MQCCRGVRVAQESSQSVDRLPSSNSTFELQNSLSTDDDDDDDDDDAVDDDDDQEESERQDQCRSWSGIKGIMNVYHAGAH